MTTSHQQEQAERRALLGSTTTATTYREIAEAGISLENQGRFGVKPSVTGSERVPLYPAASGPWNDPVQVPQEPPLGYAINDLETTGEAHEVAASLALAKAAEASLALPALGANDEATGVSFPSVAEVAIDMVVDGAEGPTPVPFPGGGGVLLRGRRL